jgi:hypothetical protein
LNIKKRQSRHEAVTPMVENECGRFHVTLGYDNDGNISLIEVNHGKTGFCVRLLWKIIARLINLAIKYHIPLKDITEALDYGHCPQKPSCVSMVLNEIKKGEIDANNQA